MFRTSGARLEAGDGPESAFRLDEVPGVAVIADAADGHKCARCWMILPEVGTNKKHPDLCNRCSDAVDALEGAQA